MNKKLKDDYIKFTLSLNTSEAREELNRLNASSRELQRTNEGLRNSMTELVASGKKGSDEYKRLEAELKSNSKAISDNNAKVKILRSSMKSTEKTYSELAKEARGLQKTAGQYCQVPSSGRICPFGKAAGGNTRGDGPSAWRNQ